jgi:hypothetical protein
MWSGGYHLLLCNRLGIKEGLHRCLSETPPALVRPLLIELCQPSIQIGCRRFSFVATRPSISSNIVEDRRF